MYTSLLEEIYTFLVENINMPDLNIDMENTRLVPLSNIDYRDKISGCLVGLAIGDILNNLWQKRQLKGLEDIKYFLRANRDVDFIRDTDQIKDVILLAESLIINQGFNPEDLANRFVRNSALIKDKTTKQFISNYRDKNMEWYNSGIASLDPSPSLRAVPVALINYGDFTSLKLISSIQSVISHADELAVASSVLLSSAVAYLLNMPPFALQAREDINRFIDFLARSIKGIEARVYTIDRNKEIVNLYIMVNNVLRQWIEGQVEVSQIIRQWGPNNTGLLIIPLSLYMFIKNINDYEKLMEECLSIKERGITLTVALTLLGAYLGFNNIPNIYIRKVSMIKELLILSDRLFELSLKNKDNNPYRRMRNRAGAGACQDELDKLLWSAIKYNKKEEYDIAVKYFEELVRKSPDFKKNERVRLHIIEAYGGWGNKLLEREEYEEALRWFKKALMYDLNNPIVLCDIAVAYLNIDDLSRAEKYVRRAVEIAPEYEIGREILEGIKSLGRKG